MSPSATPTSLDRREWIARAAGAAVAPFVRPLKGAAQGADAVVARRIAAVVEAYSSQGFHRTGTAVDQASAQWLAEEVRQAGLEAALEAFPLSRVDPIATTLTIGDRRIDGVPLFDGAFTGPDGVRGRLGSVAVTPGGSGDAEIATAPLAVNLASRGPLGAARRVGRHAAIVAVTGGRRPGLCPSNADAFLEPFGPPVLQVSSVEIAWLQAQAVAGATAHVVAHVARTAVTADNVTATLPGSMPDLPPVVVMTPRSGWYTCASERGGGLACWLEIMRGLRTARLPRPVLFVASSGHELGHLGIDAYIARRSDLVATAATWLHLGANIGAATDSTITVQASDDHQEARLIDVLKASGLTVTNRLQRGSVPAGEAEAVHRGGGRYASVIGGNALFHHPDDRGATAVDAMNIGRFAAAFTAVVRAAASA
jgi:hypothetical protein